MAQLGSGLTARGGSCALFFRRVTYPARLLAAPRQQERLT